MFLLSNLFCSLILFTATSFAATSTEVLYVTERQSGTISLLTYNVNPETAVAKQVGNIFVGASNIDPLLIGGERYLYIWNSTDVWLYALNAKGAPNAQPAQHLSFDLAHPVHSFVVNPDGKFAYAAVLWTDSQGNSDAAITLFTIDPSSGKLTNTQEVVATYSNFYTYLTGFSFGAKGNLLFARYFDNGPYTCIPGYDFYRVDEKTGKLGRLIPLVAVNADCGGTAEVTVNDQLTGVVNTCCGAGSGALVITKIPSGNAILCGAPDLAFCGDDAGDITFDPDSKNVVFPDVDAKMSFIAHIDFASSQLTESPSTIQGTPFIFFSPDSMVLYAQYHKELGIYAFQSSTGDLSENTTLPINGKVTIATATLND